MHLRSALERRLPSSLRREADRLRRENDELAARNADLRALLAALAADRPQAEGATLRETVRALARTMEAKDYYTGGHTQRVAGLAVSLAERLGYRGAELEAIEIGALVHDVGKVGIPERILHKPGPLDPEEWRVVREHPLISDYILDDMRLPPIVREIARSTHERLDGAGYPDGLSADAIPLHARIVSVVDAYDALTTDRPYRPARDDAEALAELRRHAGSQFCPRVVAELEALLGVSSPSLAAA
jgi:two-component system cell cycle response regulator